MEPGAGRHDIKTGWHARPATLSRYISCRIDRNIIDRNITDRAGRIDIETCSARDLVTGGRGHHVTGLRRASDQSICGTVGHCSGEMRSISAARPRERRDMTVPIGMPRADATSL